MLRDEIKRVHLPDFSWYPFILIGIWLIIGLAAYSLSTMFCLISHTSTYNIPWITFMGVMVYPKGSPSMRLRRSGNVFILSLVVMLSTISFIQAYEIQFVPIVDDGFCSSLLLDQKRNFYGYRRNYRMGLWTSACNIFTKAGAHGWWMNPSTPRSYWVYHAFATNNESLPIGIFSMLSTSGNKAVELLNNRTGNTSLRQ